MSTLIQDIRFACRGLRKSPGFALVTMLTLALGIGANTAIFNVVNGVLLRPLPYPEPDRLVDLSKTHPVFGPDSVLSYLEFQDVQVQARSFDCLVAYTDEQRNLTGVGEPQKVQGAMISPGFFETLGISPMQGRTFAEDDHCKDAQRSIVLSHRMWTRRFGERPDILGQIVQLNADAYAVIGVLPQDVDFPPLADAEFWIPLLPNAHPSLITQRGFGALHVLARLQAGVTLDRAQEEMDLVSGWINQEQPKLYHMSVALKSLSDKILGDTRAYLYVLLGIIVFVLLIACVNVANLVMARATGREKEIAIRSSPGAGRCRIVRQLLTESVLLGLLGGVLGVLIAVWSVQGLRHVLTEIVPRSQEIGIDLRVIGFALSLSVLTGLLFGVIPCIRSGQSVSMNLLSQRWSGKGAKNRLSHGLVVLEISAAAILLIGAGLMIRTFHKLTTVDPGFDAENLLTFKMDYPNSRADQGTYQNVLARLTAVPGVENVAIDSCLPFNGWPTRHGFSVLGHPTLESSQIQPFTHTVNVDYFESLGISLRRGRLLTQRDQDQQSRVVVVNEAMVRRCWPNEDALGQRLVLGDVNANSRKHAFEVVGVVGDTIQRGLAESRKPGIYFLSPHPHLTSLNVALRTQGDPSTVLASVRQAVRELDPALPLYDVATIKQLMSKSVDHQRFSLVFLGLFASLAVVLVVAGIYGVVSYVVARRTQEIGIRVALGAQQTNILTMILKQGLVLCVVGTLIGMAGAFALTRYLSSYLYQVSSTDPVTFVLVPLLVTGVTLLACHVPARRAARIDPMKALRYE